ncbi:hypothetical protein [Ruegeria sp. AU67]|uniref:hypothetical protein n=1 Tax=Ruegeria sp. AU67 TaxID=2108530 RepID=UPI000D69842A|nr:hypothetical protein [Ruegeria sp. AU67]
MATSDKNSKTAKPKARKNCQHCRTKYTPFRATSKYCSDSCRVLACNQRKVEAADRATKYEDSMQRSLRWHRKQEHLLHLSEDELKIHIEAKWKAREERNQKRKAVAKERYADRNSLRNTEIMRRRMQSEVEKQKQLLQVHHNAYQKQDTDVSGVSKNPMIETKRKRVVVSKPS